MWPPAMSGSAGAVEVHTTSHRGWTPEELSERFVGRLVDVAEGCPPAIRDQAVAFRDAIYRLSVHYMAQAIRSDRTTLHNKLREAGQYEAAELIMRL